LESHGTIEAHNRDQRRSSSPKLGLSAGKCAITAQKLVRWSRRRHPARWHLAERGKSGGVAGWPSL